MPLIYIPLSLQIDVIHRRLHKDILHNPVVMLNFCPDLKSISSDLRKVHGEFIFLIDRSGSMSGVNINCVKVFLISVCYISCIDAHAKTQAYAAFTYTLSRHHFKDVFFVCMLSYGVLHTVNTQHNTIIILHVKLMPQNTWWTWYDIRGYIIDFQAHHQTDSAIFADYQSYNSFITPQIASSC